MIGETISHYKILSRLGAGGMGVVYEAEDTRLGRRVAIKFLPDEANTDADANQRFQREAKVISSLNHPYICTLYDIGLHQGKHHGDGAARRPAAQGSESSACALAARRGPRARCAARRCARRAHAQRRARDIKPANLFVPREARSRSSIRRRQTSEAGRSDVGATMVGSDQLTTIGTTIGTVRTCRRNRRAARRSMRAAICSPSAWCSMKWPPGSCRFQARPSRHLREPADQAAGAAVAIKAGIPPELDHIILKALEKDRETRYQGAAELRAMKRLKRSRVGARFGAVRLRGPCRPPYAASAADRLVAKARVCRRSAAHRGVAAASCFIARPPRQR